MEFMLELGNFEEALHFGNCFEKVLNLIVKIAKSNFP